MIDDMLSLAERTVPPERVDADRVDAVAIRNDRGRQESVLGVLPGVCDRSRTTVILSRSLCGRTSLRLQSETRSGDIGWYPQGAVELSADQLAAIRPLLGLAASRMDRPETGHAPATIAFPRRA